MSRRDRHGVALIAIEECVGSAVGVNVDQSWRDTRSGGKRTIGGSVGSQNADDSSLFDGYATKG